MSSSSYIESVLPHPIGKSYAAQFQAHGFDMPSTLKFITYKDLIDVVQVRKSARYVFFNLFLLSIHFFCGHILWMFTDKTSHISLDVYARFLRC